MGLHCEPPPSQLPLPSEAAGEAAGHAPPSDVVAAAANAAACDDEEDDFEDLDGFLKENGAAVREKNMTKRRARQLQKQMMKGAPIKSAGAGYSGTQFRAKGL